ncbi:flagellar FliJ protein [Alkalispirochaeta americana]|uniref:Flagellar FliJ protein n=1 Tax=Alkalispirochaeta americana TaxID=159291 RepID=A0A1N6PLD6_9SPIO|nr:flagellar FliJ family protein [Alkalispirochaeta americana]SIQ05160.1 flagellar FliJ protein [Alkalispirochaeta americana]
MRKFHFRLQAILDIRRHQEDQRRLELGAATAECTRITGEIEVRRELCRRTLTEGEPGARLEDLGYRSVQAAYALRLRHEEATLQKELEQAQEVRQKAALRYQEARRAADVLDRLRERRAAVYRREQIQEEQNKLDDIVMSRRMGHGSTL